MKQYSYLDFLAAFGIGSAHPGGFTLTKQLLAQLSLGQHTKLLEIGCGTGRTASYIAKQYGSIVSAVEINETMIEKAKKRWYKDGVNIELIAGSVEALPFRDEMFHIVLGESVLAFTNKRKSIDECYRVLQCNGMLLVIELVIEQHLPLHEEKNILTLYGMEQLLTAQEWIVLFKQANFTTVRVLGGGTIAATISAHVEEPEWDISDIISQDLYNAWIAHEHISHQYKHILGHRIFICQK
ncbi:2-methoxy-6-polyprenyl-1,4-benzoquinol methylase, mitochondrial [Bacillus rhizoplanae]|uniref:2-methoxy-6-polyprenyl-1,4-benzoquinol methylase, mitochondrial n=1 Tax=Bacillus rhizoplanae TaxID=2880966 RepID=A0ABN8A122_9BACI|nr:class I SAM-dependent methyltransferase [Bacillus rhizoplanae]CAG9613294.1 2-methoxy-6-polyprenyl-1,4-benzoquinol methylase, mitochondrial [Bacillus rhizoplanae]